MARLVSPPVDLAPDLIEPLSGPRTVGQTSTQSISGFVQTSAAAFGLWRFRFAFPSMQGDEVRRFRGWVTSMHGGANATRWHFADPDLMSPQTAGYNVGASTRWWQLSQPWANNQPWSNGEEWASTPPLVSVDSAASKDATEIFLADEYWGHTALVGDRFGISELHFGMYEITEVIEEGRYRVWPPLRKAITTDDHATLIPVMALRMMSEDSATAARSLAAAEGLSIILTEVPDYNVREDFAD